MPDTTPGGGPEPHRHGRHGYRLESLADLILHLREVHHLEFANILTWDQLAIRHRDRHDAEDDLPRRASVHAGTRRAGRLRVLRGTPETAV